MLAFQHRQHVERIEHHRPGAKRPDVSGDDLGAGGNRHAVVIQLHPHRPVGVAGRHRVGHPVRPDVPELVDHPRLDAAGLGEVNGQGPQVPPLQRPRFPHRTPVGEPPGRHVRLQLSDDQRVERGPTRDCRPRPEHEIAHIRDARLDRALLPALRRRTDRRRKRIRAPERLKRIGLHPVPAGQHLLDRDRRVVEHHPVRHAAHRGKRRLDPIQQRLESLHRIRLREIHVGVGQGRHHILDLPQHTGDLGPRFSEVDFQRHPRPRAAVHIHLLRRRGGLQPRHIPAHRALGHRSRQRQQQPADARGRQSTILPQPLLDLRTPPIQMTGSRHRSARRRRRLRHRPTHRLDVQAQPLGNLLLRHAVHHMHLPDLRPLRHSDHLRVLLDRVMQHDSVAPLPARARKPVSRVTQGSLFTLPRGPFSSCRYQSRVPTRFTRPVPTLHESVGVGAWFGLQHAP